MIVSDGGTVVCNGYELCLCGSQVDEAVRASHPKLKDIDLSRVLLPAATLRPNAAQRCIQKQVHC